MSEHGGRRPTVNVDALGAAIDRALEHPFARLLEQIAPRSVGQLRTARENLPETLSALEARAAASVGQELDELLSGALEPWTGAKKGPKR